MKPVKKLLGVLGIHRSSRETPEHHHHPKDVKPEVERSPQWPAKRAAHLVKEPLCQACGGKSNLEVHHILPVHTVRGAALELVDDNFITLCETPSRNCHHTWGHYYDWHSWNKDVRADVEEWLKRVKKRP